MHRCTGRSQKPLTCKMFRIQKFIENLFNSYFVIVNLLDEDLVFFSLWRKIPPRCIEKSNGAPRMCLKQHNHDSTLISSSISPVDASTEPEQPALTMRAHQTNCEGGLSCSVTTHSRVTVPASVILTRSGARISVLALEASRVLVRPAWSARAGTRSSLGSLVTRVTRTLWAGLVFS